MGLGLRQAALGLFLIDNLKCLTGVSACRNNICQISEHLESNALSQCLQILLRHSLQGNMSMTYLGEKFTWDYYHFQ